MRVTLWQVLMLNSYKKQKDTIYKEKKHRSRIESETVAEIKETSF